MLSRSSSDPSSGYTRSRTYGTTTYSTLSTPDRPLSPSTRYIYSAYSSRSGTSFNPQILGICVTRPIPVAMPRYCHCLEPHVRHASPVTSIRIKLILIQVHLGHCQTMTRAPKDTLGGSLFLYQPHPALQLQLLARTAIRTKTR